MLFYSYENEEGITIYVSRGLDLTFTKNYKFLGTTYQELKDLKEITRGVFITA